MAMEAAIQVGCTFAFAEYSVCVTAFTWAALTIHGGCNYLAAHPIDIQSSCQSRISPSAYVPPFVYQECTDDDIDYTSINTPLACCHATRNCPGETGSKC